MSESDNIAEGFIGYWLDGKWYPAGGTVTEKPQAEVTERMVREWLVHDRAAAEATKGARLNLLEESKLLIGLVQEVAAKAHAEGYEEGIKDMVPIGQAFARGKREGAREAFLEAAGFIDAALKSPDGTVDDDVKWLLARAEEIRALAADPEVKP